MNSTDLVIEQFALDLAEAEENLARYRMLAVAAIHKLHDLTNENDRLREQLSHLREEILTLVTAERDMTTARTRSAA